MFNTKMYDVEKASLFSIENRNSVRAIDVLWCGYVHTLSSASNSTPNIGLAL